MQIIFQQVLFLQAFFPLQIIFLKFSSLYRIKNSNNYILLIFQHFYEFMVQVPVYEKKKE